MDERESIGGEFCIQNPDRVLPEKTDSLQISAKLDELKEMFAGKIARDRIHSEAYEKLYQEMRLYKDNFLFAAMRPVIVDLLLLYDNIARSEQSFLQNAECKSALEFLKEELLEILYRQDVEPIPNSCRVDKKMHRVLKTIPTGLPDEDGSIVEVVREGFCYQDKVLRPQEVVSKKYRPQKSIEDES